MKIWDKIKQVFKKDTIKTLPEGQEVYSTNDRTSYKITRADGTELEIWPQLDRLGNQIYEQVYNSRTNQMQCIPKFTIYADELKDLLHSQILSCPVLIDMDPNLLKNQECLQYIANNMLNKERMQKVINQYKGYAGILEVDSNFRYDKKIDMGIIETKTKTKEEYDRMLMKAWEKRDMEEEKRIREESKNLTTHYKTSHAEDLTQYDK